MKDHISQLYKLIEQSEKIKIINITTATYKNYKVKIDKDNGDHIAVTYVISIPDTISHDTKKIMRLMNIQMFRYEHDNCIIVIILFDQNIKITNTVTRNSETNCITKEDMIIKLPDVNKHTTKKFRDKLTEMFKEYVKM